MRVGNLKGRTVLIDGGRALDIHTASDGRFSADMLELLSQWQDFLSWASSVDHTLAEPFVTDDLEAPVANPAQVFAIGLNYRDHADEAGLDYPDHLVVFTKFATSLAAPNATVKLSSEHVDYETELVVVIGKEAHQVSEADGWDYVAGLCVGQDYSDRPVQRRGPAPQFSLGKSFPGFGPYGPAIVTPDELDNPDALEISAVLSGNGTSAAETLQDGNTRDLIFSVPKIIADLSEIVTLLPGDLIFTGTPAGVGGPQGKFLKPGQQLTSTISGIGSITNTFV